MHCMVSWGNPQGLPISADDHKAMEAALTSYTTLKVFPGTLVVTVGSDSERETIEKKLTPVSQERGNRIHFLISPAMNGAQGIYRGYAASTVWPELNKMTAS
jgi:hypothetical protein